MILVDSNILIDVLGRDPQWFGWSRRQIGRAALGAYLFVNPVIAAEIGWQFQDAEHFRSVMSALLIGVDSLDPSAGILAGKAYQRYRERRGEGAPRLPLPDFLIGGDAQHRGASILTRDPRFYAAYFPDISLITPETDV